MRTALGLLALWLCGAVAVGAQTVASATVDGPLLSVGGTASAFLLQYGERKMLGASAFVDADTRRHFGLEAEARWLIFNQTANVHDSTYSIGPRYFRQVGRFEPFAKGLVGIGEFNFPYNYAHGSYLVITPGAGTDFRINHRIRLRLVDFEYQYWPQFTYGPLSSVGISSGIRFRIF